MSYDYAGRMLGMQMLNTSESRSYNAASGQLASRGWSTTGNAAMTGTLTYTYSTAQNNGQIAQVADSLSGETNRGA